MNYETISLKQFYPANGAIYYVAIARLIYNKLFSRVKISCFRAKAHLVFYWCSYNKYIYRFWQSPFTRLELGHFYIITLTEYQEFENQVW